MCVDSHSELQCGFNHPQTLKLLPQPSVVVHLLTLQHPDVPLALLCRIDRCSIRLLVFWAMLFEIRCPQIPLPGMSLQSLFYTLRVFHC